MPPCYKPKAAAAQLLLPHETCLNPANPVPDDVVTGAIKTSDGVNLRFARWAPPPGRKGTVVLMQGRAEFIEKYFETVRDLRARGFAVATFDWRGQGLSDRRLSDRHKGYVRNFAELHHRPRSGDGAGGIARLSSADFCTRPFHGSGGGDSRLSRRQPLVRSRCSIRADDCAAGGALDQCCRSARTFHALSGRGGAYVPTGDSSVDGH